MRIWNRDWGIRMGNREYAMGNEEYGMGNGDQGIRKSEQGIIIQKYLLIRFDYQFDYQLGAINFKLFQLTGNRHLE